MKKIVLSERLRAVVAHIEQGAAIADVGTDHGYIPVYLAQNNSARKIIATDNKKDPLAHAQTSAKEYGVSDQIEFVQTDGLDGLEDRGLDTVVIAGMGGETIAAILTKAPWTKRDDVRLILQPQTKLNELLAWLWNSGYNLLDASLVIDGGRVYAIIRAGLRQGNVLDNFYKLLLDKHEPLFPMFVTGLVEKTRRAVAGLEKSSSCIRDDLQKKKSVLEELIRMKEETDRWQK